MSTDPVEIFSCSYLFIAGQLSLSRIPLAVSATKVSPSHSPLVAAHSEAVTQPEGSSLAIQDAHQIFTTPSSYTSYATRLPTQKNHCSFGKRVRNNCKPFRRIHIWSLSISNLIRFHNLRSPSLRQVLTSIFFTPKAIRKAPAEALLIPADTLSPPGSHATRHLSWYTADSLISVCGTSWKLQMQYSKEFVQRCCCAQRISEPLPNLQPHLNPLFDQL